MENEQPPVQALPPTPPVKKPMNKWVRLGRKILIGALITWCINTVLLKTGWHSWQAFSEKADHFTGSMVDVALRLSPLNLWNSLNTDQSTYERDASSPYIPHYIETGKVSIKDKIVIWLGYYWYTQSGHAFWIGRLIMLAALAFGFAWAVEKYDPKKEGFMANVVFPFNVVIRAILFLVGLGIAAILFYFVSKILLAIVGGLVVIFSTIATGSGVAKIVLEEARNEATETGKKTIAAFLPLAFLKIKKK